MNNQTEQRSRFTNSENKLVAIGAGGGVAGRARGEIGKTGEGDKGVQNSNYKISHGNEMHSLRNTVNNIVITW